MKKSAALPVLVVFLASITTTCAPEGSPTAALPTAVPATRTATVLPETAPTSPLPTETPRVVSTESWPPAPTPFPPGRTIVVNSSADTGSGTLRQALQDARPGDLITFDPAVFPPEAPVTISLTEGLPEISRGNLTVDASNAGVILDGSGVTAPQSVAGLAISSNANIIRGLQIVRFSEAGIALRGGAEFNLIGGDRGVGTGPLGQGNLISGNGSFGIGLWDPGTSYNTIQGNYIGINLEATATWGHSRDGIHSNGPSDNLITGNVIGGSQSAGVYLCCAAEGANIVTDNIIGTNPDGTIPLGNQVGGVLVDRSSYNVIGPDNTIAHNEGPGIVLWQQTPYNAITQNSIRDNGQGGIRIDAAGGPADLLADPLIIDFDLQAGILAGSACPNCTVEIFSDGSDEGAIFEGQVVSDSSGWFTFAGDGSFTGPNVTTTVTDAEGSTSNFAVPLSGPARSLTMQEGNHLPMTLIVTRESRELADNHIGGDYGSDLTASHENIFQLGLKWVRLAFDGAGSSLNWQRVETEPGQYSVNPVEDAAIADLADNGVNVVLNLGVGPGDGITGRRFFAEEEIERYLGYVRFMVEHFRGRVRYYELWNEPGGTTPSTGEPSAIGIYTNIYADVILRAVPIIRLADPEARIVIGALGGDWISGFPGYGQYSRSIVHMDYLRRLITSGVAPLVDAISWHPFYGDRPDDPYYQTYPDFVRGIQELAAAQGFQGEYFAEEIKFYTEPTFEGGSPPVVTERVAAEYYARAIVMHLGLGFTVSTAGQPGYGGLVPDVIRALCTVMEAASPVSVPVEIQSEATNIVTYGFSFPDGSRMVALWTNGVATDENPGVNATLAFPGLSAQRVVGIDVLNGYEQELISETEEGNLVIRNLRVRDYPIVLRLVE